VLVDVDGFTDLVERRIEFIAGDCQRIVVDVEPPIERAVQLSPRVVGRLFVQRGWVGD
jgi:hypothetical protein